jgi:DNA-binding protein H-NS
MAKKTYADIQASIERLKVQAEKIKAQEAQGVIERMREAIEFYNLKPADLFGAVRKPAKKGVRRAKYRDGNGNSWHGIGKRPAWLKALLAQGKTLDELRV